MHAGGGSSGEANPLVDVEAQRDARSSIEHRRLLRWLSPAMPSFWEQADAVPAPNISQARCQARQADALSRLLDGRGTQKRIVVVSARGGVDDVEVSASICSRPTASGCRARPSLARHLREGLRASVHAVARRAAAAAPTALASSLVEAPAAEPCAICFSAPVEATRLWCGHCFCHKCIDEWLVRSETCPTCRRLVLPGVVRRRPRAEMLFRTRVLVYGFVAAGVVILVIVGGVATLAMHLAQHLMGNLTWAASWGLGCGNSSGNNSTVS